MKAKAVMEQLSYGLYLLIAITIGYAVVGADLYRHGNAPMALVFGSYALANVGLIWSIK